MCCRQNGNGFCRWWPQTPPSLQIDLQLEVILQAKHAKHCSFSATGLKSLQLLILLSKLTFSIVSLNLTETHQSFPIFPSTLFSLLNQQTFSTCLQKQTGTNIHDTIKPCLLLNVGAYLMLHFISLIYYSVLTREIL